MSAAPDSTPLPPGVDLFARYASAPNDLGYCGPPEGIGTTEARVRASARRFSGVWPYLRVLARMAGVDDPLDHRVVDSYWHGGGLGGQLDPRAFGSELLAVIGPQAGHHWAHLTPELLDEAAGDHAFHVFGVYPWTRLLGRGMDEHPLHVLDSCRIAWGTVVTVDPAGRTARVRCRQLLFRDHGLALGEPTVRQVAHGGAATPVPDLAAGEDVALHWGRVCGRLTAAQLGALTTGTARQLRHTNARLHEERT